MGSRVNFDIRLFFSDSLFPIQFAYLHHFISTWFTFSLTFTGKLIPEHAELIPYFDEITLSIDSVDPATNEKLGRGHDHFDNVCSAIHAIRNGDPNLQININTVATRINLNQIAGMKDAMMEWKIRQWRIFRFCPLRGTAVRNRKEFEITGEQFQQIRETIEGLGLGCKLQFRDHVDMEQKYLLINPQGKLCVSRGMKDMVVGDMLQDDLEKYFISPAV